MWNMTPCNIVKELSEAQPTQEETCMNGTELDE